MSLSALRLALIVAAPLSLLSACGRGPHYDMTVAKSNMASAIAPANTGALMNTVAGKTFTYPAGIPVFGTLSPTTVSFSMAGSAPTFNVTAGSASAVGQFGTGNCTFFIALSNFPPASALGQGKTLSVTPCTLSIQTLGLLADNSLLAVSGTVQMGAAVSEAAFFSVSVDPNGIVSSAGAPIGQVSTGPR